MNELLFSIFSRPMKAGLLAGLLSLGACSFKSGGDGSGGGKASTEENGRIADLSILDPNGDIDGDLVKNEQEVQMGRNPHVVELPELDVAFLQNYKIQAVSGNKVFDLDTLVAHRDPNFRYRVGSLFIRNHSMQTAASIGKFSTHTTGEISNQDLSWVKYPEIDESYFQKKALEFENDFGGNDPEQVTVLVENSLRLRPSNFFKSIKNVMLNFYYYDYESGNYKILKTFTVEQNLVGGVNEVVHVSLDNVPVKLLTENYLKKGEFIFSEVVDFEIPEMGTTYKNLLNSVKAKCLPVIINTPQETRISYVGVDGGGRKEKTFAEVLASLFEKNYSVEENEVTKIGEFENNLPDFTYLKEVREKDKLGKWFVLTSAFNGHYFDHRYTAQDRLVLTYATGKELAEQSQEKIHGTWDKVSGGDDFKIYPLGNISTNSEIHLELKPGKASGESITSEDRDYHERPSTCGRNCLGGILEMDCLVKVNYFQTYDRPFIFSKELKGELERIKLMVNDDEFTLAELLEKKAVTLRWNEDNLHITISDPTKIMNITEAKENVFALKIETFVGRDFQGAKLYDVGGRDQALCPGVVANASAHWKIPISESSIMMDQFRGFATRGLPLIADKTYYQRFDIALSSLINNFHN